MSTDANSLHNDRFVEIGEILIADADLMIETWCQRVSEGMDGRSAEHREEIRNDLPGFLRSIGAALKGQGNRLEPLRQRRASEHGRQRWRNGWQLSEVVGDYQMLRITVLEYLDQRLSRSLTLREVLAVGLLLDDAIATALETYVAFQESYLAESEGQSRSTFENAAVGIAHVRPDGNWLRANQRLCDLVGYSPEKLRETTLDSLTWDEDRDDLQSQLRELLSGRIVSFSQELRFVHCCGRHVWVQLTGSAFLDSQGNARHLILIVEDVSVRRQLDEELTSARQVAESANDAKSRFVANLSHEIRTPMTAILGLTELALDEDLSPILRDYLSTTLDATKSVLGLLNDLLDLSRIEAGRLELESARFDIHQAVEDTLRQQFARANSKGLELVAEIQSSVPRFVNGDALRLRQILSNLISNAVKFTDQGRVIVRVSRPEYHEGSVSLSFEVEDTGIGVSKADQEKIFAPFTQGSSTPRSSGGTGLGLAIVSELVRRMKGRLGVASDKGLGSNFHFTAEFEAAPQESHRAADGDAATHPTSPTDRILDILVVEDMPAIQKVIGAVLGKRGHRVLAATNGQDALRKLHHNPFDLILMDCQMPTMDGYEATTRIRRMADPRSAKTPIVAMTAHTMRGDAEKCYAAGMDAFIGKPVDCQELIRVVEDVARGVQGARTCGEIVARTPAGASSSTPTPLNLDTAIARLGGHVALLRELIEFFMTDAPRLVGDIAAALQEKDVERGRRACHSLRGLAANFDATECIHEASALEHWFAHEDWASCEASLPAFKTTVQELLEGLKNWQGP